MSDTASSEFVTISRESLEWLHYWAEWSWGDWHDSRATFRESEGGRIALAEAEKALGLGADNEL